MTLSNQQTQQTLTKHFSTFHSESLASIAEVQLRWLCGLDELIEGGEVDEGLRHEINLHHDKSSFT